MKIKIAWFTPFNKKSAIGKFSQIVTNQLSRKHKVDIWVTDKNDLLDTKLNVVPFSKFKQSIDVYLSEYDICVYNLGDHLYNHREIYEISKLQKGIVILHDFVMHHFFTGYYFLVLKDEDKYVREIEYLYGKEAGNKAFKSLKHKIDPIWEKDSETIKYPFFEKAILGSYGVISHSKFLDNKVEKVYSGFHTNINLPYTVESKSPLSTDKSRLINILTIGNVNPNKRSDVVIETIGKNINIRNSVKYTIIGSTENTHYVNHLNYLIEKYDLKNVVDIKGYLDDEYTKEYFRNADIIMNLRNPSMEGGSWSILEAMSYSKPIIVSNNGFFEELPDQVVVKIETTNNEQKALNNQLLRLISDSRLRKRLGGNAYNYLKKNFSAKGYMLKLENFLNRVMKNKANFDLIDTVGSELSQMLSKNSELQSDNIVESIFQIVKSKNEK